MDVQPGTLLLSRSEVADLLGMEECIVAVEEAFRRHGDGRAERPSVLGVHVPGGGFHVKAGLWEGGTSGGTGAGGGPGPAKGRRYFAAKLNANHPGNAAKGLPTIRGLIVVFDAESGELLAAMDSMEVTALRTAAAVAVAARHLARPESRVVTVAGCGVQGRAQLRALSRVFALGHVYAYDVDAPVAGRMARDLGAELGLRIEVTPELEPAVRKSDICVTCTPSRRAILKRAAVRPGTFVAAVGADAEDKQELEPALFAGSTIVVDVLEQCASIGDLHHALAAGVVRAADVHAELGEIVAGRKPGRRGADEVVIFDSTGMALQDAAVAVLVCERVRPPERGGVRFRFGD